MRRLKKKLLSPGLGDPAVRLYVGHDLVREADYGKSVESLYANPKSAAAILYLEVVFADSKWPTDRGSEPTKYKQLASGLLNVGNSMQSIAGTKYS